MQLAAVLMAQHFHRKVRQQNVGRRELVVLEPPQLSIAIRINRCESDPCWTWVATHKLPEFELALVRA